MLFSKLSGAKGLLPLLAVIAVILVAAFGACQHRDRSTAKTVVFAQAELRSLRAGAPDSAQLMTQEVSAPRAAAPDTALVLQFPEFDFVVPYVLSEANMATRPATDSMLVDLRAEDPELQEIKIIARDPRSKILVSQNLSTSLWVRHSLGQGDDLGHATSLPGFVHQRMPFRRLVYRGLNTWQCLQPTEAERRALPIVEPADVQAAAKLHDLRHATTTARHLAGLTAYAEPLRHPALFVSPGEAAFAVQVRLASGQVVNRHLRLLLAPNLPAARPQMASIHKPADEDANLAQR
jgi:hypothetical protein